MIHTGHWALTVNIVLKAQSHGKLCKNSEKTSRRKTTCSLLPLLFSVLPKSSLQIDFKNHENVQTDLRKHPEEFRK